MVFTGLVPYDQLATAAPAATALAATPFPAAEFVVSLAILVGLTVVCMILILGQSRVAFAMSRDNLLPRWFSKVHPTFRTPYRITIITGIASAILTFALPLTTLGELVNIGTLAAFVLVSLGVLVLRRTQPDLPRAFTTPWVPAVPIAAALLCLFVMGFLTIGTWLRFLVWMGLGIVIYFAYSRSHSRLGRDQASTRTRTRRPERRAGSAPAARRRSFFRGTGRGVLAVRSEGEREGIELAGLDDLREQCP